jgi:hypothetical protein
VTGVTNVELLGSDGGSGSTGRTIIGEAGKSCFMDPPKNGPKSSIEFGGSEKVSTSGMSSRKRTSLDTNTR